MSLHNITGTEANFHDGRDVWAGMLRFVRSRRRRSRSSPSIFVALAWAIGPSLIGMCLFLLVVGVVAGTWPL